jgi:hypothetical protein
VIRGAYVWGKELADESGLFDLFLFSLLVTVVELDGVADVRVDLWEVAEHEQDDEVNVVKGEVVGDSVPDEEGQDRDQ